MVLLKIINIHFFFKDMGYGSDLMHIIAIENFTKDYGNKKGVFDISFHIEKVKCMDIWDLTEPENQRL